MKLNKTFFLSLALLLCAALVWFTAPQYADCSFPAPPAGCRYMSTFCSGCCSLAEGCEVMSYDCGEGTPGWNTMGCCSTCPGCILT